MLLSRRIIRVTSRNVVTSRSKSTTTGSVVQLKEVPMLPIIGSALSIGDPTRPLDFWRDMRQTYGDFFKMGIPGFGKGLYGEIFVLHDPNEMMKVLRQEKTSTLPYPKGIIEAEWPMIKFLKETDNLLVAKNSGNHNVFDENGFFDRGETWKRLRQFLQTDLLSPQSSKRYIPGMVQAAQIASQAAPSSSEDLNSYFNRCAFDMFNSLMFGELTKTADLSVAKQANIEFCNGAVEGMTAMVHQMMLPSENLLGNFLGIQTARYKKMVSAWSRAFLHSKQKYADFRTKFESDPGAMTELEKDSYLAGAIERQKLSIESDDYCTEEELIEVVNMMLSAAVDTTSSPLSWNIYHLAVNPDVQAKLFDELSAVYKREGNSINENFLKQSNSPYLHATIRESHRITPATPVPINKENTLADVEIHGVTCPKDSLFSFDGYSIGMDPSIVDNPTSFQPERFMEEAVESRKGTPAEVLDHPLLKSPFSHGSRKCPGARVANNEILIMISQLVLDWKISAPADIKSFADMKYEMTGMISPVLPQLKFERRI